MCNPSVTPYNHPSGSSLSVATRSCTRFQLEACSLFGAGKRIYEHRRQRTKRIFVSIYSNVAEYISKAASLRCSTENGNCENSYGKVFGCISDSNIGESSSTAPNRCAIRRFRIETFFF